MTANTITIPREEYLRLKKLEEVDYNLIEQFQRSLEDIKHGRVKRVA